MQLSLKNSLESRKGTSLWFLLWSSTVWSNFGERMRMSSSERAFTSHISSILTLMQSWSLVTEVATCDIRHSWSMVEPDDLLRRSQILYWVEICNTWVCPFQAADTCCELLWRMKVLLLYLIRTFEFELAVPPEDIIRQELYVVDSFIIPSFSDSSQNCH